ncbi:MAG: ribosome biogenesis factor YjgA [Desulfuromonadales bacterium]|jgi:ribosome-associated protein|nr:ribosome biogenesis factor YjgA [Desulfuromonadales bacterium]
MDEEFAQDIPLSKTRLKKLAKEVESLAVQLTELSDAAFNQFELEMDLREEVVLARETCGRGSHKRQIKHLASVLRQHPDATARIRAALQALDQVAQGDRRQFHQLEQLRDRLCDPASFQDAFDDVLQLCPAIDHKVIARLSRSVHQHNDRRAARELFRRLRDELTD